MNARRGGKRGFTLLELMVALAIVATVAATVFNRGGDAITTLISLEDRTLARWIAENEITTIRIGRMTTDDAIPVRTERRRVEYANRAWQVVVATSSTRHPLLRRVDVSVFSETETGAVPIDALTTFVGRY